MKEFNLRVKCVVYKNVYCKAESEDQLINGEGSIWDYAEDEHEMDQIDWEVESVEEIK